MLERLLKKKPDVHNFSAGNSRARYGCANFMGAWDFGGSFCRKTSMPIIGCTRRSVVLCERPCICLLSTFYKTLPSKKASKKLVFTENPLRAPSKSPSKKHLLLESLLRTLLRSVLLHDLLGVHPKKSSFEGSFFGGGGSSTPKTHCTMEMIPRPPLVV